MKEVPVRCFFFALTGGISDFSISNGAAIRGEAFCELVRVWLPALVLYAQKPVAVTYLVTTPPVWKQTLMFGKTPMAQEGGTCPREKIENNKATVRKLPAAAFVIDGSMVNGGNRFDW